MEYILYDVDKIKDYVFDSYKPKEVKGASELLKTLDFDIKTKKKEPLLQKLCEEFKEITEETIIFSKGGSGIIKSEENNGKQICEWLESHFPRETPGGNLTAVYHQEESDFATTMAILNYKSRNKKAKKLLSHDLKVTKFEKFDIKPNSKDELDRCYSCGKRVGVNPVSIWGEGEVPYCEICQFKRNALKKEKSAAESLEEICSAPKVKDSRYILAIYGDINEAGSHLANLNSEDELKAFSRGISNVIETTRQEIETRLEKQEFKYLAPITGGDDLFLFVHPAAFDLIKECLFEIELSLPVNGMKMNFAFLLAKYNFTIYHLFTKTQDLLDLTKDSYYRDIFRQTHHGFFKILEGQSKPDRATDVYPQEEFSTLYTFAKQISIDQEIHKTALYTLMESISEPYTGLEKDMNIRYFLARHREFNQYIDESNGDFYLTLQGKERRKIMLKADVLEDILIMREHFNLSSLGDNGEAL